MNIVQGNPSTSRATTLAAILERRANDYHPDLRGSTLRVRLDHASKRSYSELYGYTISSDTTALSVLVKLPYPNRLRPATSADRPRLYAPVPPDELAPLEYTTMRHIQQSFTRLDAPQFGCVNMLDLLTEPDAIVMEKAVGQTLRTAIVDSSVAFRGEPAATAVYRIVGEWLRQFHQLPNLPHTKPRSMTRDHFLAMTEEFRSYLPTVGALRWMGEVCDFLMRESVRTLAYELPLGLAHGDFAPRNVIVSPDGKIIVLDTLARWRAPIYEDLALFLFSLQLSRGSNALWTRASSELATSSQTFLAGYFDGTNYDWPALRLFILQALLDRGCSYVSACSGRNPLVDLKRRFKLHILGRIARYYMSLDSL